MHNAAPLPPGQYERDDFPRFGMVQFADRFPKEREIRIRIHGAVAEQWITRQELEHLPRVDQTSDFHCAASWSTRGLRWSGFRFCDVFTTLIAPRLERASTITFAVLRCQDGYRAALPLMDLMAADVLLADKLNGAPLSIEHGAPIRLVAPAHYGYKSAKHLNRIELWPDDRDYRPVGPRFMEHPRARVSLEERGRGAPGWLLRYLFRPLVRPTINRCRQAMQKYLGS